MGWTTSKDGAQSKRRAGFGERLSGSPTQMWKSRLSWRITLSAFLTILLVQVGMLWLTIPDYEQARLNEIAENARVAVAPLIEQSVTDMMTSPIDRQEAQRLLSTTEIMGFVVYPSFSNFSTVHGPFGTTPGIALNPQTKTIPNNVYNAAGGFYDLVLRPASLGRPYYVIARADAAAVEGAVYDHIEQTILIMLLMSGFVTTVLMIALGYWLLEPILFLRDNLLKASKNPENPDISESPFDSSDEIGGAIEMANKLIRQNADNINRIKSAAEDQIHKLAYYDTLTGLPNRTLFLQTLGEQASAEDTDNPGRFAVIALDLDHFKDINDSMGHNVGDALLRAVGKRLRASMPESATVARSGEDEFAIMMPLGNDLRKSKMIAERVHGVIRSEPFQVFNENFQIRSSIGVATFPDDGTEADQVLKNADIALNRAKEEGRDRIKEYSEDFDRAVQQRFQMLRDLRDALEHNQLLLYYQPQFDLGTGGVIGAEALIRWFKPENTPEGGRYISPADFIPVAEQSGLIVPIGEWVLRTACETAAAWRAAGHDFRIAVNVSGAQFYQSDIVAVVDKILKETNLPAKNLELEVTESVFMEDVTHAIHTLQELHALGVELAIDDFGTGYSSLSYLRQFPIDRLKIDQSFIRNALNNPDDAAITRTIIRLGHSLNLKVIAEGVETRDHETFLREQECDEVQGFRYSRPVPTDKFDAFITGYNGDLGSFDMK